MARSNIIYERRPLQGAYMISHQDQMSLFTLIAKTLKADVTCYAFGGTAMMFYGYKDETKDVDLLFENNEERSRFVYAIKKLGYSETSAVTIYVPEKLRDPHKPLVFKKGDAERFDLFAKQIFRTIISPTMKDDIYSVQEFKSDNTLTIKVLRREHIVLLKAITERKNDFEDIQNILKRTKNFDWEYLIEEALWQYHNGDRWVLLDTERTLRELRKYTFIEKKYLDKIYDALEEKEKKEKKYKTRNAKKMRKIY